MPGFLIVSGWSWIPYGRVIAWHAGMVPLTNGLRHVDSSGYVMPVAPYSFEIAIGAD